MTVPVLARIVDPGVGPDVPWEERRAVRAVVRVRRRLLMVRSLARGDLKFPGGGVEPGESDDAALARELDEECGARLLRTGDVLGDVEELRPARRPGGPALHLWSRYVFCDVAPELGAQRLDPYEQGIGLIPEWITPEAALAAGTAVLTGADGRTDPLPPWTRRETLVLALLVGSPTVDGPGA